MGSAHQELKRAGCAGESGWWGAGFEMAAKGHTCWLVCSTSAAICQSESETKGLISLLWHRL